MYRVRIVLMHKIIVVDFCSIDDAVEEYDRVIARYAGTGELCRATIEDTTNGIYLRDRVTPAPDASDLTSA